MINNLVQSNTTILKLTFKVLFYCSFISIYPSICKAQNINDSSLHLMPPSGSKDTSNKLIFAPENAPEFPGGDNKLMQYLSNTLRYPNAARDSLIQGRVVVEFQVCADGKLCDLKIVKSVHEDLDKEALRAIKNMPPWIPAKNNGQNVPTIYSLPIHFRLD